MIENPWIILRIDRRKAGSAIWAVREPDRRGRDRRTLSPHRAWRFKTEKKAANQARELGFERHPGFSDWYYVPKVAGVLFVVARLEDMDLPRPRPDRAFTQLAFAFEGTSP